MMCERLLEQAISRRVRQQAYRAKQGGGGQGGVEGQGGGEEVLAATGSSPAKKLFNATTAETTGKSVTTAKSPSGKSAPGRQKGEGDKEATGEDLDKDDADLHVYEQQLQRALKRPQQYRVSNIRHTHNTSTEFVLHRDLLPLIVMHYEDI